MVNDYVLNEMFCLLFQKLEAITGKDIGDFGNWDDYKKYCLREFKGNDQVIELVGMVKYLSMIEDYMEESKDA